MGCTEATVKTSVYRPRNPHSSPLYQFVKKHYEELAISGVVHRRVEEQVLNRTLEPFAMDLWHNEISHWIPDNISCSKIEKITYFGGLYQKVVGTR